MPRYENPTRTGAILETELAMSPASKLISGGQTVYFRPRSVRKGCTGLNLTHQGISKTMDAESRIHELKLELPAAPRPVATYQTAVRYGDLLYVSGHGPLRTDGTLILGRVGGDMDLDGGRAAARQVGLAMLATVKDHLGSLNKVARLIKVLGLLSG